MKPIRATILLCVVCIALASVSLGLAYAEEYLNFRDPYTQQTTDDEISSIHFDLTYPMALAAGFAVSDSIQIQLWDQLVDSEMLGPGETAVYANCLGSFPPQPDPNQVCAPGTVVTDVVWPMWPSMKDPATCATSRFGPYSPFFHFPRQNDNELGVLRRWAWEPNSQLVGYEAYAWDGASVLQASCTYTHTTVITTGIPAGSLAAFATYLHSLGDSYSHRECQEVLDARGAPWGTHTLPAGNIPECTYNPANWQNDDAHGREFGVRYMSDSLRTDEGIQARYSELISRSLQREGQFYPLSLDTSLAAMDGVPTLRQVLYNFVHNWDFKPYKPNQPPGEFAELRRAYADQLTAAVLAQRQAMRRLYLPAIRVQAARQQ